MNMARPQARHRHPHEVYGARVRTHQSAQVASPGMRRLRTDLDAPIRSAFLRHESESRHPRDFELRGSGGESRLPDQGVQLVRVPPAAEGRDAARLIPARLLKGDVHIVSRGLSSLLVEGSAPTGAPKMSWEATGRLITHSTRSIGPRSSTLIG
jgi:hypothetical protein